MEPTLVKAGAAFIHHSSEGADGCGSMHSMHSHFQCSSPICIGANSTRCEYDHTIKVCDCSLPTSHESMLVLCRETRKDDWRSRQQAARQEDTARRAAEATAKEDAKMAAFRSMLAGGPITIAKR